ncbi:MAG: methyltransferase domain-containing protein [Lachnospiraceae bacterium]|nr:methyltransferase domain-containing protein [Lachnospiraceae bacterium]
MKIRKICFVCNGNNSRSIMAEYIARDLWKDSVEVCSCGIHADNTAEVAQNTKNALEEIGINIGSRKRQRISEEFIGEEYYYFALDSGIKDRLITDYGVSPDRVRILDERIMDPKGCSMEVYRECRNIIEHAIKEIELEKIVSPMPMQPKDYWDSVSETKQFTTSFQAEAFAQYVNTDARILDVGCGYGRTLNELHHRGYKNLTGIDFSKGMIERGKKQFPYLDLLVKEKDSIDFPDNYFDAVILLAVLTCIPSEAEQRKLISEIRRVLKPGGILYINDFLLNTDERNISRYEKYAKEYGTYGVFELSEGAVLRHHEENYIHELTEAFEEKRFERLTFTTMNGHVSNGFFYIGEK